MRTALYVLLALAAVPAIAGQTVWKWVDEKGVTHFSDQPVPGATKMELNSAPSPAPAPAYTPPASDGEESRPRGPAYSRFAIESPQQDESIINTGGKVTVRIAASPGLGAGHIVKLYLDGALVQGMAPNALSHEFAEMPRGTHTVKAEVTTRQGTVIQETPPVTFHVRQESIAKPPVGPALRQPPPKPRTSGNKLRTSQPTYSALNGKQVPIDPDTNLPVNYKPTPGGPKN